MATQIDFAQHTDEQLDKLRIAILTEQERRANLSQIPQTVAHLCRTYREGGGDPAVLEQAVNGDTEPPSH